MTGLGRLRSFPFRVEDLIGRDLGDSSSSEEGRHEGISDYTLRDGSIITFQLRTGSGDPLLPLTLRDPLTRPLCPSGTVSTANLYSSWTRCVHSTLDIRRKVVLV